MTTRITGSFPFTAPAEVVFGVLTDPDRTYRWLPEGVHVESAGTDDITVKTGSDTHEYAVKTDPTRLRIEWRAPDDAGLNATAEVHDSPAGGSTVEAEIELPGPADDEQHARDLLAETMDRLQLDVSDNFNAG